MFCFTEETGQEYYFNTVTEESVFERPKEYRTPRPADGEAPLEVGDSGWTKYWDEEGGYEFYYNEATGESGNYYWLLMF